MSNTTAKRVRELRTNKGWSQSALGVMAGVSLRTIQRAEKEGTASTETLKALASVFELSDHNELLHDDQLDTKKPHPSLAGEKRPFDYGGKKAISIPGSEYYPATYILIVALVIHLQLLPFDGVNMTFFMLLLGGGVLSIYSLLSSLQHTLDSKSNDTELYRSLLKQKTTTQKGEAVLGRLNEYLSRYAIEKNAMIIGEDRSFPFFTKMIRHATPLNRDHLISFGEQSSGVYLIMLDQMLNTFSDQRPGLILLEHEELYLIPHLSAMLTAINRDGHLHVEETEDLARWSERDWRLAQQARSIVVGISDNNANVSNAVVHAFLDSAMPDQDWEEADKYAENGSFLWINDKHVLEYDHLLERLKGADLVGRLLLSVTVTECERFLARKNAGSIAFHFQHRYVLKVNNPETVKKIHQCLAYAEHKADTTTRRILSFRPGEGDYFWQGRAYENLNFAYLDARYTEDTKETDPSRGG